MEYTMRDPWLAVAGVWAKQAAKAARNLDRKPRACHIYDKVLIVLPSSYRPARESKPDPSMTTQKKETVRFSLHVSALP